MTMHLSERLRLIREGIMLEADDEYDLPPDVDDTDDDSNEDEVTEDGTPSEDSEDTNKSDDNKSDEDDDTGEAESTDDEPATSDNVPEEDSTSSEEADDDSSSEEKSKPGEVIKLDVLSRKILAYKNFKKYRELRDDVSELITELVETPSISNVNRDIINLTIRKSTELLDKINDYIIYRYNHTPYEINYKNYMDFVLERRLIGDILERLDEYNK